MTDRNALPAQFGMAESWKTLNLVQLIPRKELKFPPTHHLIDKVFDEEVVHAFTRALSAKPTRAQAGFFLEKLFEHVLTYRAKRKMGRGAFWFKVAEEWKGSTHVNLNDELVRDLALAITLAEPRWTGGKSPDTQPFLRYVRLTNDFFVRFEYHSDEATEILAQREHTKKHALNVFFTPRKFRIPWQTGEPQDLSVIERAMSATSLHDDIETALVDARKEHEDGVDMGNGQQTTDGPHIDGKAPEPSELLSCVKDILKELDDMDDDTLVEEKEDLGPDDNDNKPLDMRKIKNRKAKERKAKRKAKQKEEEEIREMEAQMEELQRKEDEELEKKKRKEARALEKQQGLNSDGQKGDTQATATVGTAATQDGDAASKGKKRRSNSPSPDEDRFPKRVQRMPFVLAHGTPQAPQGI